MNSSINKNLKVTHKQFIEKYNQAIDRALPLPSFFKFFLRRGLVTLRKKLYICEVEGAEQFESDEGLNITIVNSDLYLFFVVTINQKTRKLTRIALNCKIDNNFNKEKMILTFTAVKAVVSVLECRHIDSGKESRDLIDNLGLTDTNTEDKYHFRNGIAYKKSLSKDLGFVFIAESTREGLLGKIANNPDEADFNAHDLLIALKADTQRIQEEHEKFKKEWKNLTKKRL